MSDEVYKVPACKYPDIKHNFKTNGQVLLSDPPQRPEVCENCGLMRIGYTETKYRYIKGN